MTTSNTGNHLTFFRSSIQNTPPPQFIKSLPISSSSVETSYQIDLSKGETEHLDMVKGRVITLRPKAPRRHSRNSPYRDENFIAPTQEISFTFSTFWKFFIEHFSTSLSKASLTGGVVGYILTASKNEQYPQGYNDVDILIEFIRDDKITLEAKMEEVKKAFVFFIKGILGKKCPYNDADIGDYYISGMRKLPSWKGFFCPFGGLDLIFYVVEPKRTYLSSAGSFKINLCDSKKYCYFNGKNKYEP